MPAKPYKLAVKAAILDEAGRCLLLRRSPVNKGFIGCWEWPGGKLDLGEEFATALRREVTEETGLEIELTGLIGAVEFEMTQANIVMLCMEARLVAGTVRLSEEHDEFAWVVLSDMPKYECIPRVADLMLEHARKNAEKNE